MTGATKGRIAVLYDCAYPFVPGGGQKRLYEICRRLIERGWQVDWYALHSWSEPGETQAGGIRFVPVADARPMYTAEGKRSIGQTLHYGRAIANFPQLAGYDIIHMGQWPYFHFFPVALFSIFGRARLSVDWWEVWGKHWLEYYGRKGRLGMLLERVCARVPSKLIAISETGARQLAAIGVRPSRIEVIHNGIDWKQIRSSPSDPRISDVIYLGRLQPHKNVDLLIRAIGLLRDRGMSLSTNIIGDGPQRTALEALVAELGLSENVKFLGAIAADVEVYTLLKAARLFVHPSTKEGGGSITSLEANAAGLPVVAFRHPGGISPELIQQGINGGWVDEVSACALADGIATALTGQDRVKAAASSETFAQAFDWDALADQYDRLLAAQSRR